MARYKNYDEEYANLTATGWTANPFCKLYSYCKDGTLLQLWEFQHTDGSVAYAVAFSSKGVGRPYGLTDIWNYETAKKYFYKVKAEINNVA